MARYIGTDRTAGKGVASYADEQLDQNAIAPVMGGMNPDVFAIDAGDTASYSGSGQNILNIVDHRFKQDFDWYLGDDSSSDSTDPGHTSNYFTFDGGDTIRSKDGNAFFNRMHRSTSAWTIMAAVNLPDVTTEQIIFSTKSSGSNTDGVAMGVSGGAVRVYLQYNAQVYSTYGSVSTGDRIISVGYDGSGTTARYSVDGTAADITGLTANTVTDDDAEESLPRISGLSAAAQLLVNNSRLYGVACWSRMLTSAEIAQQQAKMAAHFGI